MSRAVRLKKSPRTAKLVLRGFPPTPEGATSSSWHSRAITHHIPFMRGKSGKASFYRSITSKKELSWQSFLETTENFTVHLENKDGVARAAVSCEFLDRHIVNGLLGFL